MEIFIPRLKDRAIDGYVLLLDLSLQQWLIPCIGIALSTFFECNLMQKLGTTDEGSYRIPS